MARPSRASAMVSLIDVACGSFGGLLLVSLVMIRVAPQPPEEPATGVVTIEWFLAEPCRSDEWVVESKGKRITKDKEETVDDDNAVLWSTTPAGVPGFSLRIRVPSALQETFSVEVDTRPCGTSDMSLIARQPRVRISGTLVSKAVRDALERGEVDLRCEGGVCTSLIVTIDPLETDVGQFMKCGCGEAAAAGGQS